jgi:uncharacterized protein
MISRRICRSILTTEIRNRASPKIYNKFDASRYLHRSFLSSWTKGTDLLEVNVDNQSMGSDKQKLPKVVITSYSESGFDVAYMLHDKENEDDPYPPLHMMGSTLLFPQACFLWNHVDSIKDVTIESLSPILIHKPKLDFLFLGSNTRMDRTSFELIQREFREKHSIVVEQMDLGHCIGTFNILNGEDRMVAAALILTPPDSDDADKEEEVGATDTNTSK